MRTAAPVVAKVAPLTGTAGTVVGVVASQVERDTQRKKQKEEEYQIIIWDGLLILIAGFGSIGYFLFSIGLFPLCCSFGISVFGFSP